MKIKDFTTFIVANPQPLYGGDNWVFLKLVTDDGIIGYGESYGVEMYPHTAVRLLEDMCEDVVVGSDPFRIERLWKTLYACRHTHHPDVMKMAAISAIEIACWDIIGKALNQPIYNLLGGRYHDKIRTYTYLYPVPGDTGPADYRMHCSPERTQKSAALALQDGFTAVKFDPLLTRSIYGPAELSLEEMDNAEAVVRGVREVVGRKIDILIGTHGQMTTSSAIRLAKRIEPFEPLWFEEPVPPENMDEMARVVQSTSIPIATGERLSTRYDYARLLNKQAAAIIQPALGRMGGILEAKKVAGMAEVHYVNIAPHLYCGPIEGAAAIQLDVCTPNFLIQEGIAKWDGFYADILREPIDWQNGYIIPSTKPGLGVELNEEVARKHPYTKH